MSLSIFYYCIYDFPCCCRNFNPTLCRLSAFLLSYVAVGIFSAVFTLFSAAMSTHLYVVCRLLELPLTGPVGNNSKGPGFSQGTRKKSAFFLAVLSRIARSQAGLKKRLKKKKTVQGCWLNGFVALGWNKNNAHWGGCSAEAWRITPSMFCSSFINFISCKN